MNRTNATQKKNRILKNNNEKKKFQLKIFISRTHDNIKLHTLFSFLFFSFSKQEIHFSEPKN